MLLLPILSYTLLKKNDTKISTSDFDQKYGTLYLNMNKQKNQVITYSSIFCLKRLIIGLFTVYLNKSLTLNIYVNIFGNILFIKYLCDSMPMEFKYLNLMEIMNEICLSFFIYFLFLFSDFVSDIEVRYKLGYLFIYLVIFIIAVNFLLISNSMYKDSLYEFKKNQAKKAWKEFNFLKKQMAKFIVLEAFSHAKKNFGIDRPSDWRK